MLKDVESFRKEYEKKLIENVKLAYELGFKYMQEILDSSTSFNGENYSCSLIYKYKFLTEDEFEEKLGTGVKLIDVNYMMEHLNSLEV